MKSNLFFFFLLMLLSCKSQDVNSVAVKLPIAKATYQEWVAGVEGGGSGINIELQLTEALDSVITLNSIFYKDYGAKLKQVKDNPLLFIAHINTPLNTDSKLVLGDNVSSLSYIKDSVKLKQGEAAVSFFVNGKERFQHIGKLQKKESLLYPQTN
ncbi:MAG: hypothetical protein BM564_02115 [Bacteroidetes bacterium MedPE-SWsnd-G2]|nr:MAG: hypothetical protein BM564_02115 [Bacteroidetes bacterium MedPE-SWsnd-G2]